MMSRHPASTTGTFDSTGSTASIVTSTSRRQRPESSAQPPRNSLLPPLLRPTTTLGGRAAQGELAPFVVAIPSRLTFHDYVPFSTHTIPFMIKNVSPRTIRIKLRQPDSSFFRVTGPIVAGKATNLISPGLHAKYIVQFVPTEKVDYGTEIEVVAKDSGARGLGMNSKLESRSEVVRIVVEAVVGQANVRFPEEIEFGRCPVKHETERVVYVQNSGAKATRFVMRLAPPFSIQPTECVLGKGEGRQLVLSFFPVEIGQVQEDLVVEYEEEGVESRISVSGEGSNVRCLLSTTELELPATFISRKSSSEFEIVNQSDIKLQYKFVRFATEEEDEEFLRMEKLRREGVGVAQPARPRRRKGGRRHRPRRRHAVHATSPVDEDDVALSDSSESAAKRLKLAYTSEVFTIYPSEGTIWPRSKGHVTVLFRPTIEDRYVETAWCDITGRSLRLPLRLVGCGKGPEISFSYTRLEIGHVFINSEHDYEIFLENQGDIDADFLLEPKASVFGSAFLFSPTHGTLQGGQLQEIKVHFQSGQIGEFEEMFHWRIKGRKGFSTVSFAGRVIGPEFDFDRTAIAFGAVSYDFLYCENVNLTNSSEIPMKFHLRIPEDGELMTREFDIVPQTGMILPYSSQQIRVELLSNSLRRYKHSLVVDVDGVGQNLKRIPITAMGVVPEIKVSTLRLAFGTVHIGDPRTKIIELGNNSPQKAKYEISLPAPDPNFDIKLDRATGVIHAQASLAIKLTLWARQIGAALFLVLVRIVGSDKPPFEISVSYNAEGPSVSLGSKKIEFGRLVVLREHTQKLTMTNKSPIPAPYRCIFRKTADRHLSRGASGDEVPTFTCLNPEGVCEAGCSMDLVVKARLDDALTFRDELLVKVEGKEDPLVAKVVASGRGCPLVPTPPSLELLDFGDQFTKKKSRLRFKVRNAGRNPRTVMWKSMKKRVQRRRIQKPPQGIMGRSGRQVAEVIEDTNVFFIEPARAVIEPKMTQDFVVEAISMRPGEFSEPFVCQIPLKRSDVFNTVVKCNFLDPLVRFSCQKCLSFTYIYHVTRPPSIQSQPFTVKNISPLNLVFTVRATGAFSVDRAEKIVRPGESDVVSVIFNPSFRNDFQSCKVRSKLVLSYRDHPQTDSLELTGDIQFPNMVFDKTKVDFGVIPNHQMRHKFVNVTNSGNCEVVFDWSFLLPEDVDERLADVFDIVPIRGRLRPGEMNSIQFIYKAVHHDEAFSTIAVCRVVDGPEYRVELTGECSTTRYRIDKTELNFGVMNYDEVDEREIVVQNTARVHFKFRFDKSEMSNRDAVKIRPTQGKLKGGSVCRVTITFCPGYPALIDESILLHVGDFEPQPIRIQAVSICPCVKLSLDPLKTAFDLSKEEEEEEGEGEVATAEEEGALGVHPDALRNVQTGKDLAALVLPLLEPEVDEECSPAQLDAMLLSEEMRIHREKERLQLIRYLSNHPLGIPNKKASRASARGAVGQDRMVALGTVPSTLFSVSQYVCDLGYVIQGLTQKKRFVLRNIGYDSATLKCDKKSLAKAGFLLEPSSVVGLPQYENQEMQLVFQSKKVRNLGEFLHPLVLFMKSGPCLDIIVKAVIVKPVLEVSHTFLNFGTMYTSQCKRRTMRLTNTTKIPVDWILESKKRERDDVAVRSCKENFSCSVTRGTMDPAETIDVHVTFIPTAARKFSHTFYLKFRHNSTPVPIRCDGAANEVRIEIAPSTLNFPTVLPSGCEDRKIVIRNRADVPVDVFSLNFDRKYIRDVEVLRANEDKFVDGFVMVDPRNPGEDLPEDLISTYERRLGLNRPEVPRVPAIEIEDSVPSSPSKRVREKTTGRRSTGRKRRNSSARGTIEEEEDVGPARPIILLHGPPLVGKSAISKQLQERTFLPVLSLAAILAEARWSEVRRGVEEQGLEEPEPEKHKKRSSRSRKNAVPEEPVDPIDAALRKILSEALSKCPVGLILDGLELSSEAETLVATNLHAVAKAINAQIHVVIVSSTERSLHLRHWHGLEDGSKVAMNSAIVEDLTEEEYGLLEPAAKRDYEKRLRQFRELKSVFRTHLRERLRVQKDENLAHDVVAQIMEDEEKKSALAEVDSGRKRKRQRGKRHRRSGRSPTPRDEAPAYVPLDFSDGPDDDDITSRMKKFKRTYIALKAIFEEYGGQLLVFSEEMPAHEIVSEILSKTELSVREPEVRDGGISVCSTPHSSRYSSLHEDDDFFRAEAAVKQLLPFPRSDSVRPEYLFDEKSRFILLNEAGEKTSRCIVGAQSEVEICVRFCPHRVSRKVYGQILRFAVAGSPKEYSLDCTGKCAYPDISRARRTIFSRVVRRPPRRGFLHRRYVESEDMFDFGPLLKIPDYDVCLRNPKKYRKYYDTFRLSNRKDLDAEVHLSLVTAPSQLPPEQQQEEEGEDGLVTSPVVEDFVLETSELLLRKGGSQTITVWARPTRTGPCHATVVCCIKDNPIPFSFSLGCIGAEPTVTLDRVSVDFGKLLLSDEPVRQCFKIANSSTIAVLWRLEVASVSEELTIFPREGKLDYRESVEVFIDLEPKKPTEIHDVIMIHATDLHRTVEMEPAPIQILAEAFDLKVNLERVVDFKNLKVSQGGKKTISIENVGKYPVEFSFRIPTRLSRNFRILPLEGVLGGTAEIPEVIPEDAPLSSRRRGRKRRTARKKKPVAVEPEEQLSTTMEIEVAFKSSSEYRLRRNTEITCGFCDPDTKEVLGESSLRVSVNALFNEFEILPVHGINFGPLNAGNQREKTLTLFNRGEFDLDFTLFDIENPPSDRRPPRSRPSTKKASRRGGRPKRTGTPSRGGGGGPKRGSGRRRERPESLQIGPYAITPFTGSITPKNSVEIKVQFVADGSQLYRRVMGIDISDRDPSEHASGIPFDLQGESCIPGIQTEDFHTIFEEQKIVANLDSLEVGDRAFCLEEKIFSFGIVRSKTVVVEKFKIVNPKKIPCTVDLSLASTSQTSEDVFEVRPKQLLLPSREHQYVTLVFSPQELKHYSALFHATVQDGENAPKTHQLSIELRGIGSLPEVEIVHPSEKNDEGDHVLRFPKTLVDRAASLPIVVRNRGILPSTIRFDVPLNPALRFSARAKEILLAPGDLLDFQMEFHPTKVASLNEIMRMTVLDNHFEDTSFALLGESFEGDIIFEDLPQDVLDLGDCPVDEKKTVSFTVRSNSDYPLRYEWESWDADTVKILPSVGHLHPKASKQMQAVFFSDRATVVKGHNLTLRFVRIRLEDGSPEWDDRHVQVTWIEVDAEEERKRVEAEAASRRSGRRRRRRGRGGSRRSPTSTTPRTPRTPRDADAEPEVIRKKVETVDEEPPHDIVGESSSLNLPVVAKADYARFECVHVDNVEFSPTYMFSSRQYEMIIRNTGPVEFPFEWKFAVAEEAYSIEPREGHIDAKSEQVFHLQFHPEDVGEHATSLSLVIPNLHRDVAQKLPTISVSGIARCPLVHFEMASCDYLSNNRRDPDLPGPDGSFGALDPSKYRVIELKSCGVRIRSTKRFFVLNPTDMAYEFRWRRVGGGSRGSPFNCLAKGGVIRSGKKVEMGFEFVPSSLQTVESFWQFQIPERGISVSFLVVGHASEPQIYLDTSHVNFQTVLVRAKAKKSIRLINRERIPFSFAFDRIARKFRKILRISPGHGTVAAESEVSIGLLFTPLGEVPYNFNLVCRVRRKPVLLSLNIKGEGFVVHEQMELERIDKSFVRLSHSGVNELDFERVQVHDKQVRRLVLINEGNYNFDFRWRLPEPRVPCVSISPEFGTVPRRNRVYFNLLFNPTRTVSVTNYRAVCRITNGNSYVLSLSGAGAQPLVKFSVKEYNFGRCFLFHSGEDYIEKEFAIRIENEEPEKAISYDVMFESKPHLEVEAANTILQPGERKSIRVVFRPREYRQYREVVTFVVNGLTKVNVVFRGEGVPCVVDLVDSTDSTVNFGAIRVGQNSARKVALLNRSKLPARIVFPPKLHRSLGTNFLSLVPRSGCTLAPREKIDLEILFAPAARLQSFSSAIEAYIEGKTKRLVTIVGACLGIEVKLNVKTLGFGIVVQNTVVRKKILIENHGDLAVHFKWNTSRFRPDFSISPDQGFITPNESIPLEITYHPVRVSRGTVRYEDLECRVDNSKSVFITLTGACVGKPSGESTLEFSVPVRQRQMKTITIENPTDELWRVKPSFENSVWSGAEFVEVAPQRRADYEIAYTPLVTTRKGTLDHGSVFIPLPNGKAILHHFEGEALNPLPTGDVRNDVIAKELFTGDLVIENWMDQSQRFQVKLEFADVVAPDYVKGSADHIDVPALVQKRYKYSFFAYRRGSFGGKIVFRNDRTREFLFYNVSFHVAPPKILKTYVLESAVRKLSSRNILIPNPMEKSVELRANAVGKADDLEFSSSITIPPRQQGVCKVSFFPLVHPTEKEMLLNLTHDELGLFQYQLNLRSQPCGPEQNVHFKAALGDKQAQLLRFTSYTRGACEFLCNLDDGNNFALVGDSRLRAPGIGRDTQIDVGREMSFEVSFEPSRLGEFRDRLTISSAEGGEYVFLLFGMSTPPLPRGPVTVFHGFTETVSFKNVFSGKIEYRFQVSNPQKFQIKPAFASIGAKQKQNIQIGYRGDVSDPNKIDHAKLTISSRENKSCQWIFYLLGRMKEDRRAALASGSSGERTSGRRRGGSRKNRRRQ